MAARVLETRWTADTDSFERGAKRVATAEAKSARDREQKIRRLKAAIASVQDRIEVEADVDTDAAKAELRVLRRELKRTGDEVARTNFQSAGLVALGRDADRSARSVDRVGFSMAGANKTFTFLRNNLRTIGFGGLIVGATGAASALVSVTASLGPVVGLLGAIPGAATAGASALMSVKLATGGVSEAVGGLNEKLDTEADAFKNLSAEGKDFARFLDRQKASIEGLQRTAQRRMFPGLEDGIRSASKNLPVFNRIVGQTSGVLGGLARRAGEMAGSSAWGRDLASQSQHNAKLIDNVGTGALHVGDALRHVMVAARPLTGWLGRLAKEWGQNAEQAARAGRKSGELTEFFERTRQKTKQLASILANLGGTLFHIGQASRSSGDEMLRQFEKTTAGWEKWTGSIEGQNELRQWFDGAKAAMDDVWAGIGRVINRYQELRREGKSTSEALGIMLSQGIQKAIPAIAEVAGRSAGKAAWAFFKGWLASDVWGKLFVGLAVSSKLGLFRGLGTKAGSRFASALGQTKMGEAAANLASSYWAGARVKFGALKSKIGDLFKRIFSRAGAAAGTSAAGSVAGSMVGTAGGETAGSGIAGALRSRWSKFKGVFSRFFGRLGGTAGGRVATSLVAAMAVGGAAGEAGAAGASGIAGALARAKPRLAGIFRGFGKLAGKWAGGAFVLAFISQVDIQDAIDKMFEDLDLPGPDWLWSGEKFGEAIGLGTHEEKRRGGIIGSSQPFSALGLAAGGMVPGTGNTDKVPAMLTPGELVVPKGETRDLMAGKRGLGYADAAKSEQKQLAGHLRAMGVDFETLTKRADRESEGTGKALRDHLREGTDKAGRFVSLYRDSAVADIVKLRERGSRESGDLADNVTRYMRDAERDGGRSLSRFERGGGRSLSALERSGSMDMRRLAGVTERETSRADRAGERAFDKLQQGASKSVGQLTGAVYQGMTYVADATNKALKAFGVKPIQLSVPKPGGGGTGESGKGPKKATGGVVVPGVGSGDKVPVNAMVEPGEGLFVLNRNAMGAYQALNDDIPRFASGGWVGSSAAGLNPAVQSIAQWAMGKYNASATSTLRPGDSDSFHGQGAAVDLVSGDMMAMAKGLYASYRNNLEELFYDPWGGWDSGGKIGAIGGHMDHVHIAALGKAVSATVSEVKKITVEGTPGPLKDMAQAAIDKMREAANKYIASKMPTDILEGSFGAASGNVEEIFGDVIRKFTAPFTAGLALMEAGWAESGMKNIDYGDSSSQGPLQLLSSTAAGLGVDPNDIGAVASLFMTKGFYGRGGALDLVQGNPSMPAHLVAQSVQGSAFSSGSNYAAQEGAARASLRREGLYGNRAQRGGFFAPIPYVGAYKDGGILPRDGLYMGHRGETVTPQGEVAGARPNVKVIVHGSILTMDDIEDAVEVVVEDMAPAIVETSFRSGGAGMARGRQIPGSAGRAPA